MLLQRIIQAYSNSTDTWNHQPFNAFLSGFSATVGQFVLTGMLQLLEVVVQRRADQADHDGSFITDADKSREQVRVLFSITRKARI